MSRYRDTSLFDGGKRYGTSDAVYKIRNAIASGDLTYKEVTLTQGQRLDMIAGIEYGNSRYWWIIAAASNIGWGLQVPAFTNLKIPPVDKVLEII